ncbi:MAG TPA: calcium/sodium antiporter [Nitrosopumilaceae archaeon]|nr:calcium/sodium antiporter [Nitrosopumilaceae archaeon]
MEIAIPALLTIIGIAMLCYGGNWLVSGGVAIAQKLGISKMLIGMTVVAYGTSTPELAASVAAAGEHGGIILGNIIGSNIANVGMVIGIAAIMAPLVVKKVQIKKELPIMIGVSFLLVFLSLDGEISQYDGILLIVSLITFTAFIYKDVKKQKAENIHEEIKVEKLFPKSYILLGIGIALLYAGAVLTIDNAVILAESFGLSERIIGITVIAIGTSLPELITSIIAIRKGHTDIGIGNIIGSNIYNILMIMGVGATIAGVAVVSEVYMDYAIMIGFALVLFISMRTGLITRPIGVALTIAYLIYLATAFYF